ncbi:SET and MYND domain-containing protein 4 [Saguinus oedipus]|uniref:SET and MYND domain-containing protein 4 n=1 Tax=Saguinus oedipus TaxID=9490 RepID=A0ABQ9VNA6_SAGOE|nr:SET and MYND domain-containing protein 4 [Saguinus oedipus]
MGPEDEIFLKRLSKGYFVGKDSGAPLFYREEGNKTFQEKDYTVAAVLYSKIPCSSELPCLPRLCLSALVELYVIFCLNV